MIQLDDLDHKATSAFEGYVVRKDLVRTFSRQFPVPTYVVEFLLAGATAVQVGTASFVTPGIAQTIAEDLEQWMQANGVHDVRELIGGAQRV